MRFLKLSFWMRQRSKHVGGGGAPASSRLLENGDFRLLENGDKRLLEG